MGRAPRSDACCADGLVASRGAVPFSCSVACGQVKVRKRSLHWGQRCRQHKARSNSAARIQRDTRSVAPWALRPMPPGGRVVLFSQIRDCASVIETFVCHYAALGFFKCLLYLDDPKDIAHDVLKESGWIDAGFVEVTEVNDQLRLAWPQLPSWGRVGSFAGMEVQSRQILNNEHAHLRAKALGADWLLHVDSDELLCLPKPAPDFFAALSARGCTMYTFTNVEGVPETPDSTDVLRSVRVFRQNMGNVPRNPAAGNEFFSWQLRLGGWFISYENGKTAVNVKHGERCLSVCMWNFQPQLDPGTGKTPDGSTCTWYTNNKLLYEAAVKRRAEGRLAEDEEVPRFDLCPEAVLLHFCVCDFASFWRKRWTQLGYLSASDQFRVRASSGAMMARFYRLQREGRQGEARELYETMCVCQSPEVLEKQVSVGVLLRHDPEHPCGQQGPAWPAARRPVRYAELASRAEDRGAHFDAWLLRGKAIEAIRSAGGDLNSGSASSDKAAALAALCCRRAASAMNAGLPGCAIVDATCAQRLGDVKAFRVHAEALQALGHFSEALTSVERGLKAVKEAVAGDKLCTDSTAAWENDMHALADRLRTEIGEGKSTASKGLNLSAKLPTPTELQQYVIRAVRPDEKESRLYRAVLPIAMSWWQELDGDESKFCNALGRAAIAARNELVAVDACVRPRPMKAVREAWDPHEDTLKESGACAVMLDFENMVAWWSAVAHQCRIKLGEGDSITLKGCDSEEHVLNGPWKFCSSLVAEIARAFKLRTLQVLTEMRVSRPRAGGTQAGPECDNGGLLPDNRRETSIRMFVPADGAGAGTPATLMLRTKDGERSLSFDLRVGRVFVWWSRQTFHQVLGAESYFCISCWGVVPQKPDATYVPC